MCVCPKRLTHDKLRKNLWHHVWSGPHIVLFFSRNFVLRLVSERWSWFSLKLFKYSGEFTSFIWMSGISVTNHWVPDTLKSMFGFLTFKIYVHLILYAFHGRKSSEPDLKLCGWLIHQLYFLNGGNQMQLLLRWPLSEVSTDEGWMCTQLRLWLMGPCIKFNLTTLP